MYNAVQLATAPALAVSVNSPTFLGHRLWEETRVALFKQSVDDRAAPTDGPRRGVPRVCFGLGWVKRGALELFEESVELHEPLLPVMSDEDPVAVTRAGGIPLLAELRLHQGTVWRWNRAIYDPSEGGHLRIEMRALPSGPTVADMMASAAFLVGLALELSRNPALFDCVPFEVAEGNFYRAAQHGLAAELLWPQGNELLAIGARELVHELLPVARRGLLHAEIDAGECERWLEIIERRASAATDRRAMAAQPTRRAREQARAQGGARAHAWRVPRPLRARRARAYLAGHMTQRIQWLDEARLAHLPGKVEHWLREIRARHAVARSRARPVASSNRHDAAPWKRAERHPRGSRLAPLRRRARNRRGLLHRLGRGRARRASVVVPRIAACA